MTNTPCCFVIMPFRPELHFFYLFTQKHLEEKHSLHVERGDYEILTVPLMKKIEAQIVRADFLLADVTGSNPNVFYELGIAHNQGKPVILITQDEISKIPVDIKPYEFIQYNLAEHVSFYAKLDSAFQSLIKPRYTDLYEEAKELAKKFNLKTGFTHKTISEGEFSTRLGSALNITDLPQSDRPYARAAFLLPKIISHTEQIEVMERIIKYLGPQQAEANNG